MKVPGFSRVHHLVVCPSTGLVRFSWEPPAGYQCPYCVKERSRDPKNTDPAPLPTMHRGEVLRHCLRYHAFADQRLVCPLCKAFPGGNASLASQNLQEHIQLRHGLSLEYGGLGYGPVPPSFSPNIPAVVAMDVPLLSTSSISCMANVLALDTCPREVKRLIVNVIQSFAAVPHNQQRFKAELIRVAVDLASAAKSHVVSTCMELTACLNARRTLGPEGASKVLPKIPSEKPQCDRRLVDVLEVLLALPCLPLVEVACSNGTRQRLQLARGDVDKHAGGSSLGDHAPFPSSQPSRYWVPVDASVTSIDAELRAVPAVQALFAALDEALALASHFETVENPTGDLRDAASHAVSEPGAEGFHHGGEGSAVGAGTGAGAHDRAPGGPPIPRQRARTYSILEPAAAVSATMDTVSKRFRYLLKAFFLAHPVTDASPYRVRQRESARARLMDPHSGGLASLKRVPSLGLMSPPGVGLAPVPLSSSFPFVDPSGRKGSWEGAPTPSALQEDSPAAARRRLVQFVEAHSPVINSVLAAHPDLLMTHMSAMVRVPQCCFLLSFNNKRPYFRAQLEKLMPEYRRGVVPIHVRRSQLFLSSYDALKDMSPEKMRGRLQVHFAGEEGVDAGGVTREWYSCLAREIFKPDYALFTPSVDSPAFQPNPLSMIVSEHLQYFKFVGRIIGKAILDEQALDAHFTRSFYKHILGVPVTYHDIESIDPVFYKSLREIMMNPIDDLYLCLTFSADRDEFGVRKTDELIPGGSSIEVTDANKSEYVRLMAQHRLTMSIRSQIDSFLEGLQELLPQRVLSIFDENELELLVSGMPTIDLDDLKAHTDYVQYTEADPIIQWFWSVLKSFSQEERARLIQFATGTSKVPLEGFAGLQGMNGPQRFSIHRIYGGDDRLPTAHTCFNQIDLPQYSSEEVLRSRLLLALREGAEGFGFI